VVNVGHGVREIADSLTLQAGQIAYVNGSVFTHDAVEELATEVAALSPGDLDLVYPLGSGSEAVEAALKLARQYWVESGRSGKHKVLALAPSYHGNTLLALSASSREQYQTYYRNWLVQVVRAPAFYQYRCECRGTPPLCPSCTGAAIESAILREGPETVAALIAEPIGGSSTGASVPGQDYWRRVREICDRHQVLFVADEILTGAGRTGTWSALESYGVVPDIMVLGKGLAGGYAPLSAVVAPRRIVDVLARGSGGFLHAQTFSHHPTACAAGAATIRYLRQNRLVERCAAMGALLHRRGYRQATAKAPLRETLAAALVAASEWDGLAPLVDPMCGSGTIPIEAALLARRIPPGARRPFAIEGWPGVPAELGQSVRADLGAGRLATSPATIAGSDRDAGAIESARGNAERAGVATDVDLGVHALSAMRLPPAERGWIVSNPPYGVRVGDANRVRDLWAQLGNVLRRQAPGWRVTLLSPDPALERQLQIPMRPVARTTNGGIPVRIVSGVVARARGESNDEPPHR
jgi:adenosylmethionine-8-amino-7-oxononanoate aminotransferase